MYSAQYKFQINILQLVMQITFLFLLFAYWVKHVAQVNEKCE